MSSTTSKVGRQRLLGEARLARARDRGHVVAVEARGRDVHDRVDLVVFDHRVPVGAGVLDAAEDLRDPVDALGIGIGRRGDPHEPVVGEEPQRRRVRLRDRAAPDQPEPQRLTHELREKLGAAFDGPCSASIGSWRSP